MEITRPLLFVGTLFFVAAILVLRFIGLKFSKEWWLRIGALTAGMISLSEPSLVTTTNALRVIFLLDRSASCRDYAHLAPQLVRQKISSLPPDANVVVGVFDRELEILYAGRADSFPVHLRTGDFLREGSELSNALRVVASQTKESEKVTVYLFGDGNYTRSPSEILPQNLLKRFVLHAIPLPRQRDASISAVHLPTLKAKQNATLYVSLSSNYETEATLDVLLPDGNKKRFPLRLTKGITKLGIPFLVPDTDSIVSLSLESPGDSDDTNNEALVRVKPSGRVRILYVASAKNRPLRRALEDVYSGNVLWLPPQALPQDSEPLKEFDCIVLDEVPSNLLAAGFASAVLESVERCGVGFVMLGVNSSFGAGSYANSPIEKLLPVNCTPRERIPLALTLLLDKSDSMGKEVVTSEGRRTKFEIAVESAISALGALKKGDSLAVLLFSSRPYRIRPLSRINSEGEIKATSHEIRRISPGDSTFLFTALEVALKEYENVDKGYRKAILLVSDGKSMEEKKIEYEMFKRKDVAVYSVGIGEDRNRALLSEISARTGGAYYEASFDPYDMRETFFNVVKEIEKYTSEIGEYEVSVKEGMMSLPAVRLYSRTAAKEGAKVQAEVGKYPLLATWRYGAGVTLALTTALDSTSAPKWLVWDGLVSFLRWMLDHVLRKTSEGDWWFDVQTSEKGTVFLLSAPSASEPLKNGRLLIGNRYFPLLPRTPSVYEAEASLEGDISSVLLVEDEGKIVATISVNILNSEKRVVENNVARLKRIVSDCGGELLSSVDFLNHSPVGWRMGKTGLWRYLILISLLCLVLSLLLRFLHLRR